MSALTVSSRAALHAVRGLDHVEAFALQEDADQFANMRIVVDHQYFAHRLLIRALHPSCKPKVNGPIWRAAGEAGARATVRCEGCPSRTPHLSQVFKIPPRS